MSRPEFLEIKSESKEAFECLPIQFMQYIRMFQEIVMLLKLDRLNANPSAVAVANNICTRGLD